MKPHRYLYFVVLAAGILLRTYQINYNFDGDELFSAETAKASPMRVLAVTLHDRVHPPLHPILLSLWVKAFGNSEVSTRMLSVILSVLFLLALYWLARRWTKDWAALWILSVCSWSPFFVYYGQQARPYALITLLTTLSVVLLLKTQDEPFGETWKVTYGLTCAGIMYSQYLGVLIILPQLAAVYFSKAPRRGRVLLYGTLGIVSLVPWILALGPNPLPENSATEHLGWIGRPDFVSLADFYVSIFGWLPLHGSTRILIFLTVIAISSLILHYKSVNKLTLLLLGSMGLLGPLALYLVSVFGPISFWATRQLIGSAIFLVCLLGIAIDCHRPLVAWSLAILLLTWCVIGLPDAFPKHSKPPWRQVASLVNKDCNDTCQVVAAEGWISVPLSHYSNREIQLFPDYASHSGEAERVMFLCRPARCNAVKSFTSQYKEKEKKTITWSWLPPSLTEIIDVYYFEKPAADQTTQDPSQALTETPFSCPRVASFSPP